MNSTNNRKMVIAGIKSFVIRFSSNSQFIEVTFIAFICQFRSAILILIQFIPPLHRTKWKRQTAVGLELLAEAGNYAAFQRLYGGPAYLGGWPYPGAQGPPGAPPSAADLYYRQAAAAALQKPLPYRLYPGVPSLGGLGQIPGPSGPPFPHMSASNSLSSLSSYYQTTGSSNHNNNNPQMANHNGAPGGERRENGTMSNGSANKESMGNSSPLSRRSPSPTLNPGSPPGRSEGSNAVDNHSDDEDTIQV